VPFLTIVSGGQGTGGNSRYELTGDQVYIGRNPGNDIVVEGIGIAGYHARILMTEQGHLLIEERASNGIWIEEQRVTNVFLHDGVQFRLGKAVFEFEADETEAPPSPSPTTAPPVDLAIPPPPAAPAAPDTPDDPDTPAWALADLGQQELMSGTPLSMSSQYQALDDSCPGCKAPLVGMERYCAMCGSRTKYGGRGRVMFFKVFALLVVLGAGGVGVHMLTDGELTKDGYARALDRVFAGNAPPWLEL
jgi:hypothetical protein